MEKQARELFGKQVPDAKPVDNPLSAYAEFAGRVMQWMEHMDQMLTDLRTVGYSSEASGEQIHAAIQLYERSMDRANQVLGSYARLKIDERLAAITQEQAAMVIRALDAVIAYFGASGQQAIEARKVAAKHLRIVSQEAA